MVGTADERSSRAVSEASAMAILVGLTVIVTASVGVSVLFIDNDDSEIPSANFTYRHYSGNAMLIVEHQRGDAIPAGQLRFRSEGTEATWATLDESRNETDAVDQGAAIQLSPNNAWEQPVRTVDTVEVYYDHGDGNTTLLSTWRGS